MDLHREGVCELFRGTTVSITRRRQTSGFDFHSMTNTSLCMLPSQIHLFNAEIPKLLRIS